MAGDLALPRLAQSLRSLTDVRTFLRPVLVVWPAAGLVLGLAAHFFGWEYWAGPVWAAATAPVLVVLLIEIVAGLRRGDVGLDVVAALAMRLLHSKVKQAGGQSSWARREHIDRTMLNKILNGRKPITKEIIRALKLCNVYAFDDD